MESSIETIIGIIIFVIVISWSIFSINLYLSSNSEDNIRSTLLEYAIFIKNYIIMSKVINDNLTDPSFYGINSKISIIIKSWIFQYDSSLHLKGNYTFPSNSKIPEFIDKAEAIGAFMNESNVLVVFKVIVYGQI